MVGWLTQTSQTKAANDNNLVPGLKLCECGERPDPSTLDLDRQKVDAAFYHTEHAPGDGAQHWPDQIIPVEFKRDEVGLDPWDDGKDNISTETISRKHVRAQCISYSELLHAIQHRVALFMLVVIGTSARFVRWDRSGTIVTRAFDYVENWEFFCEILWRISLCSDTQLGLDPTATRLRPGDADYDRMTAAAQPHAEDVDEKERDLEPDELPADRRFVYKYVRTMFSESVNTPWPRYRIEVPNVKGGKDDEDDKDNKDGDGDKDGEDGEEGDEREIASWNASDNSSDSSRIDAQSQQPNLAPVGSSPCIFPSSRTASCPCGSMSTRDYDTTEWSLSKPETPFYLQSRPGMRVDTLAASRGWERCSGR